MQSTQARDELLIQYLDGALDSAEVETVSRMLESDPQARAFLRAIAEHAVTVADINGVGDPRQMSNLSDNMAGLSDNMAGLPDNIAGLSGNMAAVDGRSVRAGTRGPLALWAVAGGLLVALTVTLMTRSNAEPRIAEITGLGGSLLWTGDGGIVSRELSIGTQLVGGTIESVSPDSWAELTFRDGSTVTISGTSVLTISDHAQKELYLREGSFSADVMPQSTGKPMLVHTRSAVLEVLGTQFKVETGLAATLLNVTEGKVRVHRRSDGSTVDVSEKHRVVAAADRTLLPVRVPESVGHWNSQLSLGPRGMGGQWIPRTDDTEARIRAIPSTLTTREGKTITLYAVSFEVSRGDKPSVILKPNSRLRIRGRIANSQRMYFGVTVRHDNGDFAGNFQAIRPSADFQDGTEFDITLAFHDFHLDPSLRSIKDQLPSVPDGLVVKSFWCHSLNQPSGLEILEVELIPPTEKPLRN